MGSFLKGSRGRIPFYLKVCACLAFLVPGIAWASSGVPDKISVTCENIPFSQCLDKISSSSNIQMLINPSLNSRMVTFRAENKSTLEMVRLLLDGMGIANYAVNEDASARKIKVDLYDTGEGLSGQSLNADAAPPQLSRIPASDAFNDLEATARIIAQEVEGIPGPTAADLEAARRGPGPDDECAPDMTCRELEAIQKRAELTPPEDGFPAPGPTAVDLAAARKGPGPDDECAPGVTCGQLQAIQKRADQEHVLFLEQQNSPEKAATSQGK